MEDTSLVRKVLFYILIILTIIFIFIIFFPNKSYVQNKFDMELSYLENDIFNQNINSMFIASNNYFETHNSDGVYLKELIDNNLLVELRDSNNDTCDPLESNVIKKDNSLIINLSCPDKKGTVTKLINENDSKLLCLYQYKKKNSAGYTEWGAFSEWQENEINSDELTNVETKIEQVSNGTKIVTKSRKVSVDATKSFKLVCPSGYVSSNNKCKKETYINTVSASVKYTCPSGYNKVGTTCQNKAGSISATKTYFCTNYDNLELKLNGLQCDVYRINYTDANKKKEYYSCPSGFSLSGNKCVKDEYYDEEIQDYKDVTLYRYQKREKIKESLEIKWSKPNNTDLINNGFVQEFKISCEI